MAVGECFSVQFVLVSHAVAVRVNGLSPIREQRRYEIVVVTAVTLAGFVEMPVVFFAVPAPVAVHRGRGVRAGSAVHRRRSSAMAQLIKIAPFAPEPTRVVAHALQRAVTCDDAMRAFEHALCVRLVERHALEIQIVVVFINGHV